MTRNLVHETRKVVENSPLQFKKGYKSEKNVEDNIIRPLLRSLGWGSAPAQIIGKAKIKLKEKRGEADFVLYLNEMPVLGVEVKNMGTTVRAGDMESNHVIQLVEYIHGLHPMPLFGLLTNGAVWHLFSVKGYEVEPVWAIDILDDDLDLVTKRLSDISPENIEGLDSRIEADKKKDKALKRCWNEIMQNRPIQIETLAKLLKEQVEQAEEGAAIEYVNAQHYLEEEYKGLPSLIAIAQSSEFVPPQEDPSRGVMWIEGKEYKNTKFFHILQNTWEHLAETGNLTSASLSKLEEKPWITNASSVDEAKSKMQKHARPYESKYMRGWYVDFCHTTTEFLCRAYDLLRMCGVERPQLVLEDGYAHGLKTRRSRSGRLAPLRCLDG